jgi:endonuclease/exonuclease/phosphatase family metal-dependent hydrolase
MMPGLLHATVNVRGRRVSVLTAHLDYRADPAVRRQQVAEILRVLDRDTLPIILAGDMNATPDADELQPLFRRLSDVRPGFPSQGYTYPSSGPTKRIDYILVSRHFHVELAGVAPVSVADHRPVAAQLSFVRR